MAQPNAMISAVIMAFSVVKVAFSCAKVIVSWLDQDLYHSERGGCSALCPDLRPCPKGKGTVASLFPLCSSLMVPSSWPTGRGMGTRAYSVRLIGMITSD